MSLEDLPLALAEIIGFHLKEEELGRIFILVPELTIGTTLDLSQQEFAGIAGIFLN